MPNRLEKLVLQGLGLLGGSIALAARERGVARRIVGLVRSPQAARRAVAAGVIDEATTDPLAAAGADLVVSCVPVGAIAPGLLALAEVRPAPRLLTDVGSVKGPVIAGLDTLPRGPGAPVFVGSHPLAGDHRTGPEAARADLLAGRVVVVTPTAETPADALERVSQFWRTLGAEVVALSPAEHDERLAASSHVPHLVAAALAASTPEEALPFTATGWRDATRIAAGDPALWRDILLANRQDVLGSLGRFERQCRELADALRRGDADRLEALLQAGKDRRDSVAS